jgi:hypothetical protein
MKCQIDYFIATIAPARNAAHIETKRIGSKPLHAGEKAGDSNIKPCHKAGLLQQFILAVELIRCRELKAFGCSRAMAKITRQAYDVFRSRV